MLHMSGEMTKAMENHASGCCINIGTLESIAVSILPEILTGYSDKHPKVSVQIENGPTFGPRCQYSDQGRYSGYDNRS